MAATASDAAAATGAAAPNDIINKIIAIIK